MPGAILVSDHVVQRHGAALRASAPERPLVVLREGGKVEGDPAAVEVAFFSADLYPARTRELVLALRDAPDLRWMHSFAAGVDHPWFQTLLANGIRLTTSSGASALPIAQTVMLYLLALSRDLPGWLVAQGERRWSPRPIEDLRGQTLAVLGLGPIGREVARLGTALGMRSVGFRRTPQGDEPCETRPLAALDAFLPETDWLVLALPLADETRHLLDARRLALLPPRARVVNVGRGGLVHEPALVAALAEKRLAGAALDVFEIEPLPAASPLWTLPNVIVTPHSSGTSPAGAERATELFVENLALYARGAPLRNEVARPSAAR